jgi:hypothetical protein
MPSTSISIRPSFPDDFEALARLAALDSASLPREPVLLAEEDGELRAALSLTSGEVVADPFVATASFVALLQTRAAVALDTSKSLGARTPRRLRTLLRAA